MNFDEPTSFIHSLDGVEILFRWGGWVGWLEKWGLKLTSAKVVVEVEVEAELGNGPLLEYPHGSMDFSFLMSLKFTLNSYNFFSKSILNSHPVLSKSIPNPHQYRDNRIKTLNTK